MTKLRELSAAAAVVIGISFFATQPAAVQAQTQSGERNLVVFLGTASNAVEQLLVGTGVNAAREGSVLGTVIIGSSVNGNVLFTLYDSGTNTTSGKAVIGTFSCTAPNSFTFNQAVQYGILMVNTGCKAALTYLAHK